jgi:hypothetical protein
MGEQKRKAFLMLHVLLFSTSTVLLDYLTKETLVQIRRKADAKLNRKSFTFRFSDSILYGTYLTTSSAYPLHSDLYSIAVSSLTFLLTLNIPLYYYW